MAVDDVFREDPGKVLAGQTIGQSVPLPEAGGPVTLLPMVDARTVGLERLLDFFSRVRFNRPSAGGQPLPYNIPRSQLFGEQPSDSALLKMPSITTMPTEGKDERPFLGSADVWEESRDVLGRGTVVVDKGAYWERLTLEVWASSPAMRHSVVGGLSQAFTSLADSYSLRLTLPDYFAPIEWPTSRLAPMVASYSYEGYQLVDDPGVGKNRRRALVFVEMLVPSALLVRYVPFNPRLEASVTPPGT